MKYHHQNLTDGRLPLWRHGRARWRSLAWEWAAFHRCGGGASFSVWRWGLQLGLLWFWLDLRLGGRRGGKWSVSCFDGCVWIGTPWKREMEWRSSDPWWRKSLVLHVKDWLLGSARHEVTKGAKFEVTVPLPEGSYRAVAQPEVRTWKRRWYVPIKRSESVWLDIPGCIPFSGKGENSWDCGDDGLCGIGGDTTEEAIGNAVASVLRSRRRYGHDSKNTGREPVVVLNEAIDAL